MEMDNAKMLFAELTEICHNAKTLYECNDAWNRLMSECLDANSFKIPLAYKKDFYELRALLQGKLSILNIN
ncbi:MAG: hypothetical protein WAS34_18920 [Thiolinea sp.]